MNDTHYDAIILPGGGVNRDGSLEDTVKARLDRAADLYSAGNTTAIITCGSHGYKEAGKPPVSEAQAYAEYLKAKGVPDEAVLLETKSQESLGNLLFAKMDIVMQQNWHRLLVIPTYNQSTERVAYLLKKVFGSEYTYDILRVGENTDPANVAREAKALKLSIDINELFADGDHEAIYKGLMATHPAYGGTKWTIEELANEMTA